MALPLILAKYLAFCRNFLSEILISLKRGRENLVKFEKGYQKSPSQKKQNKKNTNVSSYLVS